MKIEGFGNISSDKLLSQINKLKENGVNLPTLQAASNCFSGFGIKTLSLFPDSPNEADDNKLLEIEGIGETRLQQWREGWVEFSNFYNEISTVLKVIKKDKQTISSKNLFNLRVVFTGFRDKELENMIKEIGGEILSSISNKTSHLIVKDKNSVSSKTKKGREFKY